MPTYEVDTSDGHTYEVDVDSSGQTATATAPPPQEQPGIIQQALKGVGGPVGMAAQFPQGVMPLLQTLGAPAQIAGEALRTAPEGFQGFRPPSIAQTLNPALKTANPPIDPFTLEESGLKGLAKTATNGLQAGAGAVEQAQNKPTIADMLATLGISLAAPAVPAGKAVEEGAGLVSGMAKDAGLVKAADPEILAASQKAGVPLTAAGLSGGGTQASIEGMLARLPFSKDVMMENSKKLMGTLEKLREPIIGTPKDAEELGPAIQQAFSDASNAAYKNAKGLYDLAGQAIPEGTKIPIANLQGKAQELLDSQMALPKGVRNSQAVSMLQGIVGKEVEGGTPTLGAGGVNTGEKITPAIQAALKAQYPETISTAYDYPILQEIRSELNSRIASANAALGTQTPMAKGMASPEVRVYEGLKSALDKDLSAYSDKNGGVFKQALDTANKNYAQFKDLYKDNKFVQNIISDQSSQSVVNKISKLNNPDAMNIVKNTLPTSLLNDVRSTFIKGLTESKPDQFSPTSFVTKYERLGEQKLTDFLGADKMAQLKPLYQLSKASGKAESIAGNPSGTGQSLGSMMALLGPLNKLVTGHPFQAAAQLGGEMTVLPEAARAYASPLGTKLLTGQTNIGQQLGDLANTASKTSQISPVMLKLLQQLKSKYDQRRL